VSLPHLSSTVPADLEQLVTILLPSIYEAVQWAYLRYRGHICQDEFDDLSQQIILTLIEEDCRRLRSFNCQSSFKTWLQTVVNNHVYKYFYRQKQTESLNEVNHGSLTYSPPQDQEIDTVEKQKLLSRALGRLSKQERLLYQLCFVFEEETDYVANVFKIDISNVYKRKHRLIHKLTKLVGNHQGN
jgi:RNA polymerase sigma factor (sigma-70 family)